MDIRVRDSEDGAKAIYNFIEPGDGTRYTVMHTVLKDGVFVAIGAGDKIEGGYHVPNGKGIINSLREVAWERGDMIENMRAHAGYYQSHTGIDNIWTCVVAVLLGLIFQYGSLYLSNTDLIKNIYRGNHRGVFEELSKV